MLKQITIQLTDCCNLRCPYCFADSGSNVISNDNFDIFCKFCVNNCIENIHITGGEPFLHPYAINYIQRLSTIADVVIYSNLTIPHTTEAIFGQTKSIHYLVNINEPTFYTSEQYTNLLHNIKAALKNDCQITFSKTIFRKPFSFQQLFDLGKQFGIYRLRLSHSSRNSDYSNAFLSNSDIRELYQFVWDNLKSFSNNGFTKVYFDCPVKPCVIGEHLYCSLYQAGFISSFCPPKIVVSTDMNIYQCYIDKHSYGTLCCTDRNYNELFNEIQKHMQYEAANASKNICKECDFYRNTVSCGCPYS